ncbi:DUF4190 domain-containing protein [Nocardia tengchongensis]|uniref:DUF4190 domain-containing protein n=1 Tax=Nocardia tengchongensis TaxID=2055889 RepID=UPI001FE4260F|nr:DUF4190 domain-containing protein [Nocardia tengchongensis]
MTYDAPPPGWDPQSQGQQPNYYQQPGYNPGYQPPLPGYYPPGYYGAPAPDHPQAVVVLILGVMSLVFCQLLGPVAWIMGGKARREIAESNGAIGGSGMVTAGWICGIVATAVILLAILFVVFAIIVGAVGASQ